MKQLKPFVVYGFTIFTNAAISFGTFSILTHHLTEVDYGIINLYNSFIVLLIPFINIGVPYVLNVDFFKMDRPGFRSQFTNALFILLTASVVFTILAFLFNGYIQKVIKVNLFFSVTVAASCMMLVLNDIILNLFRNKEKYFLYAGFVFTKNIIEIGLTLLFVVGMGYAWAGRLGSNLLALLFITLVSFIIIKKWRLYDPKLSKSVITGILFGGIPFIPERLAIFTMGYSDRFFIDHFSGTADVGYYGAGAQVALIVSLSIATLNTTFHPVIYRSLSKTSIDYQALRRAVFTFLGISALVTACVIISTPLLFQWFIGPKFQPGKIYAFNLAIGLFFWSIYNVFVAFLFNLRRNKLIMRISFFGMAVSIISNFINVKRFGALGATYTSMLVYFSMAVVTVYFVHKYYSLGKILSGRNTVSLSQPQEAEIKL
jgi:O-antigen/teichoic acid export membrane protein